MMSPLKRNLSVTLFIGFFILFTMITTAASKDLDIEAETEVKHLVTKFQMNPTLELQQSTIKALVKIGTPAVGPLIEAFNNEDYRVRNMIVLALDEIPDKKAVPVLIKALKDTDALVRGNACNALSKLHATEAIPVLIETLKDDWGAVRHNAIEALRKMGAVAVQPLALTLKHKNSKIRANSAYVLGTAMDNKDTKDIIEKVAVISLINALADKEVNVRVTVAWALGNSNDSRAVEPLIATLKDNDFRVRQSAAIALGNIGDKRALKPLQEVLKTEENENLIRTVKEVLQKLEKKM